MRPLCSAGLSVATPDRIGRLAQTGTVDTHAVGTLRCPFLLNEVQPIAMIFPHLFCRNDFPTKLSELNQLMLDRLQPLVPPSVSDLSICPIQSVTPKLLI